MRRTMAVFIVAGSVLLGRADARQADASVIHVAPPYIAPWPPQRNFDSVYPRKDLQIDALAAKLAPDYIARPWYLTPYRHYSYYRPWYTYGYYGPTWYRYHYSPSWGYRQPWYGPQYLNPGAIAPPAGEQLYHW